MLMLVKGQRQPLGSAELHLTAGVSGADTALIALDAQGRALQGAFVNAAVPRALEGALTWAPGDAYTLRLGALSAEVDAVVLVATGDLARASVESLLAVGAEQLAFELGAGALSGRAARVLLVYRRSGLWRVYAAAESAASLGALVPGVDLSVSTPRGAPTPATVAATPAPRPPAPITLAKAERQKVLLAKAERAAPDVVPLIQLAKSSLHKRGLDVETFEVKLVLDVSISMRGLFASGAVQRLAERSLALSARLDDNGEVEVILFGRGARDGGTVQLDNVNGFVGRMRFEFDPVTQYAPAMQAVRQQARTAAYPTLVLFITDGDAHDADAATREMVDASREPIFWKFMAIGASGSGFRFLTQLDTMSGRAVDNANFFSVADPARMGDQQLFELLSEEIDAWLEAARAAGIVGSAPGSPLPPRAGVRGAPTPPDRETAERAVPWWKKLFG
ncbi:vWA domain-containing protein [Deinococcus maricopensis]|uniref:von Willebrand factor type A n=1 Tax=Deinococcus maricopensis (strain DSM 21211 / LMG 22137 / NRRL B-23946 / LB-34) TaxID=709986 RepID=E8U4T4_DEIML|nr:VWA domain-containing protein [Deinococcus maricopensis]ADV66073.1 von Willebrand factor type A [Deinococcus maricopensis DSM 21211]